MKNLIIIIVIIIIIIVIIIIIIIITIIIIKVTTDKVHTPNGPKCAIFWPKSYRILFHYMFLVPTSSIRWRSNTTSTEWINFSEVNASKFVVLNPLANRLQHKFTEFFLKSWYFLN